MVNTKFKLSQRTSGGAPDTDGTHCGEGSLLYWLWHPQPLPPWVSCHSPHFFSPHSLPLTCSSLLSPALHWNDLLRSPARSMSSSHSHHPHLLDSPVTYATQMITPTRNAFSPVPVAPTHVSVFFLFPPPDHSLVPGPFLWLLHFTSHGNHFQSHDLQYDLYSHDSQIFLTVELRRPLSISRTF